MPEFLTNTNFWIGVLIGGLSIIIVIYTFLWLLGRGLSKDFKSFIRDITNR